jgi:hypothetical protein
VADAFDCLVAVAANGQSVCPISQSRLETITADARPVKTATLNNCVAAVKSFLGFAHRVGFTRFNAGPLIMLKKAPTHPGRVGSPQAD